jgi:hypothetical protein
MTAPAPIREIAILDAAMFQRDVVANYTPVVIRGLVRDWPAVTSALQSTEAVAEHLLRFDHGAAAEAFVGPPEIGGRFFYSPDMTGFNFERRRGGFGELLRYLLGIVGKEEAPAVYAGALETAEMLPGFAEANPLPLLAGLDAPPRIWLGNRSIISTHFDVSDNVACVVAGRRRFTLFPPDQIHNLYVGPLDRTVAGQPTSMVELNAPDFERFPGFREALAAAMTAELEPGDAIYIPALWWHPASAGAHRASGSPCTSRDRAAARRARRAAGASRPTGNRRSTHRATTAPRAAGSRGSRGLRPSGAGRSLPSGGPIRPASPPHSDAAIVARDQFVPHGAARSWSDSPTARGGTRAAGFSGTVLRLAHCAATCGAYCASGVAAGRGAVEADAGGIGLGVIGRVPFGPGEVGDPRPGP